MNDAVKLGEFLNGVWFVELGDESCWVQVRFWFFTDASCSLSRRTRTKPDSCCWRTKMKRRQRSLRMRAECGRSRRPRRKRRGWTRMTSWRKSECFTIRRVLG